MSRNDDDDSFRATLAPTNAATLDAASVGKGATLPASTPFRVPSGVPGPGTRPRARRLDSAVRLNEPSVPLLPMDESVRYERIEVLGEGGMGKVWLLRDQRIGRRVALKELHDGSDDTETRNRFLREARLQGQLEHPAVVPVYDLGVGEDGNLFFTMKRVRGVTLADVIQKSADGDAATLERFSQRRLLTAFSQVCLAIQFAHDRGVMHRDLKPENLMLGDHGEIYVLDWGVARVLREDGTIDDDAPHGAILEPSQSGTGLIGTPGYIPPELLRGEPVGPRGDVFALGAILFELLTYAPLFAGSALLRLQRALEPIDVPTLVAAHDRQAAPELVAECARATTNDPQLRTASARELHDAIEAWLDGERDQELRRHIAEKHLGTARTAMAASADDLDAHKRALRETGRALAIKPDHPEARALILQLFASTPTVSPPEVEAAIENARAQQSSLTARGGMWGMTSMLGFFPVLALIGVRSWTGVAIFGAMIVVAIVLSAAAARRKTRSDALLYLVVLFNNVVFALCTGLYGPLIMVPTMVITNTVSFSLHLDRRTRMWAVFSACLAVGLPVTLQMLGVLPPSYVASGQGLLIVPHWLALPPNATILFIALGTLIAIVNGSRAVAQIRDELNVAERRLQMQRWQLQQLLPDDRD